MPNFSRGTARFQGHVPVGIFHELVWVGVVGVGVGIGVGLDGVVLLSCVVLCVGVLCCVALCGVVWGAAALLNVSCCVVLLVGVVLN